MDSYSYATISSSSNSSSSSSSTPFYNTYSSQVEKKNKPYYSSLHGVRKLPSKPITKQPIAPLPPTPPKIYKVEAINFKEVVQILTAAPEFQSTVSTNPTSGSGSGSGSVSGFGSIASNSRRLQDVAPPPLDLSPVSLPRNGNNTIAAQWRDFLRPTSSSNNIFEACNDSQIYDQPQERSSTYVTPRNLSENNIFGSCSPLANFPLSPASFAWCSSILLSPAGTLTSPSAVL